MSLPRKTPMQRGGRIRPKKRKPSEFARIYHSRERVRWVKSCRCIVAAYLRCDGPIENAHTENGGMGRKGPSESIVPACRHHHAEMHTKGARWFEERYAVDLKQLAMCTDMLWQLTRSAA